MKYVIHHQDLLGTKEKQHFFEEEVAKKIKPLENILSSYSKHPFVEIYLSKISPTLYRVSISLKLKSKLLYVETKSENPLQLIHPLIDKLRDSVKKYLVSERKEQLFKRKARREEAFAEHAHKLEQFYAEKEREQFNHLIQQLTPSLKQYALRFLKLHGKDRKTALTMQEILDEIYIALFERFSERPAETDKQTAWSYKIANETLKKLVERYTEDAAHKVDLEALAEQEMKSLEEMYTRDADGNLVMYEELDDISYKTYGAEIFPTDQLSEYFSVSDAEDTSSPFYEHVSEVLETCDAIEKHVFELYWLDELTEEEISEANGVKIKKVKEIIENITEKIMTHLKKTQS